MKSRTLVSLFVVTLIAGCSKPSGAAEDPAAPVAKVDGKAITNAELAAETKAQVAAAESRHAEEIWGIRSQALEAMIDRRLLEAQAKKEGITVDALLEREVTGKVPPPAEAELQAIYDRAKASGRPLPPFPQVKGEIEGFVRNQAAQNLRQAYVAKLRAASAVEVLLPPALPPKLDVKAEGPSRGAEKAPVTIVEFSDYECEFCGRAEATVRTLLEKYPGKVRLVYRNYPLSIHPHAAKAAEAALCAGEQGRYWEMHALLFANQKALEPADLKKYARTVPLDPEAFDRCLDSGRMAAALETDRKAGESLGLNSTPSFFVNGRLVAGAQPPEKFGALIDWELAAAKR